MWNVTLTRFAGSLPSGRGIWQAHATGQLFATIHIRRIPFSSDQEIYRREAVSALFATKIGHLLSRTAKPHLGAKDANDLVVDVFRKFIAHCPAHFLGQFAEQVVGSRKPADVGYCLKVPCDHVWHVMKLGL
jgi:hypothetical protein